MVKFVNEDFLSPDLQGKGVMVVDTNLQGVWETGLYKAMKDTFPGIYKKYMRLCLSNSFRDKALYKPGDVAIFEADGYKFALLFTKTKRKNNKDVILANMEKAIDNLMILIPSDMYLYSPVLGREDKCFTETLKMMHKKSKPEFRNWFIYRKNLRS